MEPLTKQTTSHTASQKEEVRRMRDQEGRNVVSIAQLFQVSGKTIRRA